MAAAKKKKKNIARSTVIFSVKERHSPLARNKLYSSVIKAHACDCEQLVQSCYMEVKQQRLEPTTFELRASERSTVMPHKPDTVTTYVASMPSYSQLNYSAYMYVPNINQSI